MDFVQEIGPTIQVGTALDRKKDIPQADPELYLHPYPHTKKARSPPPALRHTHTSADHFSGRRVGVWRFLQCWRVAEELVVRTEKVEQYVV